MELIPQLPAVDRFRPIKVSSVLLLASRGSENPEEVTLANYTLLVVAPNSNIVETHR